MPLNLASPGILVREVDLTIGRVDPTSERMGAIVAPFAQGPVNLPTVVENEQELLSVFGKPYSTDKHYEDWLTASSFLSYGGPLMVVRASDSGLVNAGYGGTAIIRSTEHYEELGYDDNVPGGAGLVFAKNPGSWANGLRIGIIDAKADQTFTVSDATGVSVNAAVRQDTTLVVADPTSADGTKTLSGHFKGIVTEVNGTTVSVKLLSHHYDTTHEIVEYQPNGDYRFKDGAVTISGAGDGSNFLNVTRGIASTAREFADNTEVSSFYKLIDTQLLATQGNSGISNTDTVIGADLTKEDSDGNSILSRLTPDTDHYIQIGNSELHTLNGATISATGITLGNRTFSAVGEYGEAVTHPEGTQLRFYKAYGITSGEVSYTDGDDTTTTPLASTTTKFQLGGTVGLSGNVVTGLADSDESGEDDTGLSQGDLVVLDDGSNQEVMLITSVQDGFQDARTISNTQDWFNQQILVTSGGSNSTAPTNVKWGEICNRPGTSEYAEERGARFDELHVVVIDGDGTITGNAGTILEKHLNLSKAKDATFSSGSPSNWRKYLYANSALLFGGKEPDDTVASGFISISNQLPFTDGGWDQDADDGDGANIFNAIGNVGATAANVLAGGKNYGGSTDLSSPGSLNPGIDDLITGYGLFENAEKHEVDFILMGSAKHSKVQCQALAAKLIQVAESRKDAVAFISPFREAAIIASDGNGAGEVRKDSDITNNVLEFFSPLTSSSYAVFDSGYKYMYDRFNNTFRYIPLNGDIAGTCARNDINNFPWFSPAGTSRGTILNAIKLAYNPSKLQRDELYSNRINPVIFSPGAGIILFGDKTGLTKASAFDRINVRRLFIFLEDAISAAAKDQLFEFNDEITRTNFVNIVEPFLRDVQAKRGIQDYIVICDETNNTPAIIDSNEFVADIYIKPARSINFIGLTFVATRTGVAFEEVIGNV